MAAALSNGSSACAEPSYDAERRQLRCKPRRGASSRAARWPADETPPTRRSRASPTSTVRLCSALAGATAPCRQTGSAAVVFLGVWAAPASGAARLWIRFPLPRWKNRWCWRLSRQPAPMAGDSPAAEPAPLARGSPSEIRLASPKAEPALLAHGPPNEAAPKAEPALLAHGSPDEAHPASLETEPALLAHGSPLVLGGTSAASLAAQNSPAGLVPCAPGSPWLVAPYSHVEEPRLKRARADGPSGV